MPRVEREHFSAALRKAIGDPLDEKQERIKQAAQAIVRRLELTKWHNNQTGSGPVSVEEWERILAHYFPADSA